MEEIVTYDGTTALRKECRFIKGNFYIKNKQCFYISDKWYRINSSHIAFDHEVKKWVLKGFSNLVEGIIDIHPNGEVEMGFFSKNATTNVRILYRNEIWYAISKKCFNNHPHIVEGINDIYYFNTDSVPKEFYVKLKPKKEGFYKFPFNYGSDDLIPEFSRVFNEEFKGETLLSDAFQLLKDYTFGVEFETEKGAIPEKYLRKNGLIACRDGSISGFEYTTIPLKGEKGLQALKAQCYLLRKYCSCSANESMHVHIGGYPRGIRTIAALYRLALILEKEIYALFPYYYANTGAFKKKSYCGPLPVLAKDANDHDTIFNSFYHWISGGDLWEGHMPTGNHPMDRSGQQKWNIGSRYVWCNFIPMIWGTRGTVEFRCHTPSVNAQKVINWLYICVAILEYAKKNVVTLTTAPISSLGTISLSTVLKEIYPAEISNILVHYINQRKAYYKSKNDHIGENEIFSEELNKEIFILKEFV